MRKYKDASSLPLANARKLHTSQYPSLDTYPAAMFWLLKPIAVAGVLAYAKVSAYTWPDEQIDLLEEFLYQQAGDRAVGIGVGVTLCNTIAVRDGSRGRLDSAEWLRTAYHDMATADVGAGIGGIDASIGFETDHSENIGSAFNGSLDFSSASRVPGPQCRTSLQWGRSCRLNDAPTDRYESPFKGGGSMPPVSRSRTMI